MFFRSPAIVCIFLLIFTSHLSVLFLPPFHSNDFLSRFHRNPPQPSYLGFMISLLSLSTSTNTDGREDALARINGADKQQIHAVLKLIAEADRAAALVEAACAPQGGRRWPDTRPSR